MDGVCERMPNRSALETEPGNGAQKRVPHLDHVRGRNGSLEPVRASTTPARDQHPVSQFGDRLCREVQLVAGETRRRRPVR